MPLSQGRSWFQLGVIGDTMQARIFTGFSAARWGLERFAGHSLRAGLATAAAKAGKSERSITRQTGHRSERMVRRYIRDASLFSDNAAAGLL